MKPMKAALIFIVGLCALNCLAETNDSVLRRTGGIVIPKDNGKRLAIVNSCGASTNAVMQLIKGSENLFHIPVKNLAAQPSDATPYKAAKSYKNNEIPAVIYIYSGEKDGPILSVHVDDAIATINVTPLRSTTAEIEADRLSKELYRAYGLILGAYYSAKMPSVLSPAYSVGQIDNIRIKMFSPLHISSIMHTARMLDLPILRPTTYAAACRMGWAPPPTNDIQRVIWNETRQIPTNPIKIEFDPAKGK